MLYNLREYHRPRDVDEALRLLQRTDVKTVPLGGGTNLVGQRNGEIQAAVDLADLGLDTIEYERGVLRLGAMVRLQTIVEELQGVFDGLLADAARQTAGWHVRNAATVGGTLAARQFNTPLSVVLAAVGAELTITGHDEPVVWPNLTAGDLQGQLITAVSVPVPESETGTAYEQVGRTPADLPIVSAVAVAREVEAGRIAARLVVGGLLADGLKIEDLRLSASQPDLAAAERIVEGLDESALLSDYLGSADYRRAVASVLAGRALDRALASIGHPTGREG